MKISIKILGSTGSIGLSVLKIIDVKKKLFKINLLSANKNYNLICSQIRKYKPKLLFPSSKVIPELAKLLMTLIIISKASKLLK